MTSPLKADLSSFSLHSYDSCDELSDDAFHEISQSSSIQNTTKTTKGSSNDSCLDTHESAAEEEVILEVANLLGFTGVSKDSMDELFSSYERMRNAQSKYTEAQVLFDAVSEAASDASTLPTQTKQHVRQLLERVSVLDYVVPLTSTQVDSEGSSKEKNSGVLGLSQESLDEAFIKELPLSDTKALKVSIASQLNMKLDHLSELDKRNKAIRSKVSGPILNSHCDIAVPNHTLKFLELKKELEEELASHQCLLVRLDTVLSSLADIKKNDFPSAVSEICSNIESRSSLLLHQLKALNIEITKESYTEDSSLLEAYKELRKQLNVDLEHSKTELSNLKDMEEKYMKLKGTEYDNLLKQYKNLKKDLEQKNYALKNLMF